MPKRARSARARSVGRYAIDSLEPRRLLTFTFSGTPEHDHIEMRPSGGGSDYDFFLNGQFAGSTSDNDIVITGLGGNDLLDAEAVRLGTDVELRGGPGNDVLSIGSGSFFSSFNGHVNATELPNEGTDRVVVDHSAAPLSQGLTIRRTSFGSNVTFDNNTIELKQVDLGSGNDNVTVESVPGGMRLILGDGNNTVRYGGSANVLEDTPAPGFVQGGAGTDTVIFDDRNGNSSVPGAYDITPARALNQALDGVENVELIVRRTAGTGSAPNTITMTGDARVSNVITLRTFDRSGFGSRLFLGTQTAPVDLDDLDPLLNVDLETFDSTRVEIWDENADQSPGPITFDTLANPTRQVVAKGTFNARFTVTAHSIGLSVMCGTGDDSATVLGAVPGSSINVRGGDGNDALLTFAANGHLAEFFTGQFFTFDGQAGNDRVVLDDSAAPVAPGTVEYDLHQEHSVTAGSLSKNGDHLMSFHAERVEFTADGSNNLIRLGSFNNFFPFVILSPFVTINAGPGNDTITTFDPALGAGILRYAEATVIGGAGSDTLVLSDNHSSSTSTQYSLFKDGDRYGVAAPPSTYFLDDTLERLDLEQNDAGTTTRVNAKRSGLTLNVGAGGGDDSIIFGGGDLDSSGFDLANTSLVGGAGSDSITFDDRFDAEQAGESETYAFGTFTLTKGNDLFVHYSAFEHQALQAANAAVSVITFNTINLNAISSQIESTTITGGGLRPNDVNFTQGNLNALGGLFNVNLGATGGTVNVNDQADTGNDNYSITAAQFRKTVGPATHTTINYSGLDALVLSANASANNIFVGGTAAGTAYTVNGGGGDDMVTIGGGNVGANLLGRIHVNGGADLASVAIDNRLDAAPSQQTLFALTFTDVLAHTFAAVDGISIENGTGGGNLSLNRVSVFTFADSPSTNQSVFIGNADLDFNLQADCSIGRASRVFINDLLDTGNDGYVVDNHVIRKTTPGARSVSVARDNGGVVELHANHGNNTINVRVDQPGTNLRLFGNGGNDQFLVSDAAVQLFSTVLQTVSIDTGAEQASTVEPFGDYVTVNSDAGTAGDVGAKVRLLANDIIRRLTVNTASFFEVPANVTVQPVEMNLDGGTIDLAGGALLSRAGGPSIATFRALLTRGRAGGAWNGTNAAGAINSSLAAGTPLGDGVGYGLGSQVAPTSIGSFSIGANDTLVRYALDGDADLDGNVNLADFNRLASNFGLSARQWFQGDFNYDGTANLTDFNALAGNFGASASMLAARNRLELPELE